MLLHERGFHERVEQHARNLGRLRRGTRETIFEWEVERLCHETWFMLCQFRPTAADRVRQGMSVDAALAETDRETREMNRLLGL